MKNSGIAKNSRSGVVRSKVHFADKYGSLRGKIRFTFKTLWRLLKTVDLRGPFEGSLRRKKRFTSKKNKIQKGSCIVIQEPVPI